MSWIDTDLAGISTELDLIPEGTYLFSLLAGARFNQWNPAKLDVGAKIAEGELKGRVVYFSYGDPDKVPSMYGAFKRLEKALSASTGVAILENQSPVDYLNQPEVVGGLFVADIRHRVKPAKEEGAPSTTVADLAIFKVKAAPEV